MAKVKTITAEQLDLVGQLIGGCGMFLVVVAMRSDWRLLLAWTGAIVVMGITMPIQQAMITGEDAQEQKKKKGIEDTSELAVASASAHRIVGDAVLGIRTVASFNLEQHFYDNFAKST